MKLKFILFSTGNNIKILKILNNFMAVRQFEKVSSKQSEFFMKDVDSNVESNVDRNVDSNVDSIIKSHELNGIYNNYFKYRFYTQPNPIFRNLLI